MGLHRGYGDLFPDVPGQRGVHSAGGGASVEAPPWRPGHVGHTPQPLVSTLIRARVRGILETTLARVVPTEYAAQNFQRPQHFEAESHVSTLLRLEDFQRRGLLPRAPRSPMDFRDEVVGPALRERTNL